MRKTLDKNDIERVKAEGSMKLKKILKEVTNPGPTSKMNRRKYEQMREEACEAEGQAEEG